MLSDTTWLEDAAATSRPFLLAAVWLTGFVFALRRRAAAGAWLVAVGFALLAAVRLGSLIALLVLDDWLGDGSLTVISFDSGVTVYVVPNLLLAAGEAIACLAEGAGAAFIMAGMLRSWREPPGLPDPSRPKPDGPA